jgi:ferredoxin
MQVLQQILFAALLGTAIYLFSKSIGKVARNIKLGRPVDRTDNPGQRLRTMLLVAFGQSKMFAKPLPAFLHGLIYVGFLVINIEVLEIVIDGLTGGHRLVGQGLSAIGLGGLYDTLTVLAEAFMVLVFIACLAFLYRRHVSKVPRFQSPELTRFPRLDANIILWTEMVLIIALVIMNASDNALQLKGSDHYHKVGFFPFSGNLVPAFMSLSETTLIGLERAAWWVHIVGILTFLNYLPYSKHFHIMMAFPNTYYSNLKPVGEFGVNNKVLTEVKAIFDPNAPMPEPSEGEPQPFGAKDVFDLPWKNLMEAYSCTECGRCTAACPANITGKKLSPRKIMMDTRDRLEEVGRNIDANGGTFKPDGRSLLHDYITTEELWACTSCNACVQACPVNIEPLSIILQLRQHLVLDESQAPEAWNSMFKNIENNQAPWAVSVGDRFNWAEGIEMETKEPVAA